MADWFQDAAKRDERDKQRKKKAEGDVKVIEQAGKGGCVVAHVETEVEEPPRRGEIQ